MVHALKNFDGYLVPSGCQDGLDRHNDFKKVTFEGGRDLRKWKEVCWSKVGIMKGLGQRRKELADGQSGVTGGIVSVEHLGSSDLIFLMKDLFSQSFENNNF